MLRDVKFLGVVLAVTCLFAAEPGTPAQAKEDASETVVIPNHDDKFPADLNAYIWKPATPGPWPAVIMLHGRAGSYSSLAKGKYDASTLSKRHKFWGEYWAKQGYLAMHVDSFAPRGFPTGFAAGTYKDRPDEVSSTDARPRDVYAALAYLRSRPDVIKDRIGLHGWSHGGMTTLESMGANPIMGKNPTATQPPTPETGFRAAISYYPGCLVKQAKGGYAPYAPVLIFTGTADEEVDPINCDKMVANSPAPEKLELHKYDGAQHGFDDPSTSKQSNGANAAATEDSIARATAYFAKHLKP